MIIKGLVIAGSYHQYNQWIRESQYNPREYVYVSDPCQFRGIRGVELHRVGTWYERQDIVDASEQYLCESRIKEKKQ